MLVRRSFGLALAMLFCFAGSSDARGDRDDRSSGKGPIYSRPGWYVGGGGNFALLDSGTLSHPEKSAGSRGFGPGANMRAGYRFANRLAIEFESNWMRHQDIGRADFLRGQNSRITQILFELKGNVPGEVVKNNDGVPAASNTGFNRRGKIFGVRVGFDYSTGFTGNEDCPGQQAVIPANEGPVVLKVPPYNTDETFNFFMCGPLPTYWFRSGLVIYQQQPRSGDDIDGVFHRNRTFFFDGDSLEARAPADADCGKFDGTLLPRPGADAPRAVSSTGNKLVTSCRRRARNPKRFIDGGVQFPADRNVKVRSDTLALTVNLRGYPSTEDGWPAILGPFSGLVTPETLKALSLWGRIQPYGIIGGGIALTQVHTTYIRTTNRDTFFGFTREDIGAQPFCSFRDFLGLSYGSNTVCGPADHSFPAAGIIENKTLDETEATVVLKGGLGVDIYASKNLAVSVEGRFVWIEGFGNVPIDLSVGFIYRFH